MKKTNGSTRQGTGWGEPNGLLVSDSSVLIAGNPLVIGEEHRPLILTCDKARVRAPTKGFQ